MADRIPELGKPVEMAVKLRGGRWQGRGTPQAEILDRRYVS